MRLQVKKWGNSASVRIPASIMAAASMRIDQTVDIREDGGRIVIEPVRKPEHTLEELLEGMDLDTFPDLVDYGPPVGKEIW